MARLKRHVPAGTAIAAGPRLASHFAGRNDLFLIRRETDDYPADFAAVESLAPQYGENRVRLRMLASPGWKVIFSEYLDERLIQLFARDAHAAPTISRIPPSVIRMDERQWQRFGAPIPSPLPGVELRGRMTDGTLLIGMRLLRRFTGDLALAVRLNLAGEVQPVDFFSSFGDGLFPAHFAAPQSIWLMQIPLRSTIERCRVDVILLPLDDHNSN